MRYFVLCTVFFSYASVQAADEKPKTIARSAPVDMPPGFTIRVRSRGSSSFLSEAMYHNPETGESMTESQLVFASRFEKLERRIETLEFKNASYEAGFAAQAQLIGNLQDCVFVFQAKVAKLQERQDMFEKELQAQLNAYLAKRSAGVDARIAALRAEVQAQQNTDLDALDERIQMLSERVAVLSRNQQETQAALVQLQQRFLTQELATATSDSLR